MTATNSAVSACMHHRNYWKDDHCQRAAEQLIEEMAELTVELSHKMRGRDHDVLQEIADVEICLIILKDSFGIKLYPDPTGNEEADRERELGYRRLMSEKADRLFERLEEMRLGRRATATRGSA